MTKSPELQWHDTDCEYRQDVEAGNAVVPLTITLRIPLELGTTIEQANELAQSIALDLPVLEHPDTDPRRHIDAVYYAVNTFNGHDLGL